MNNSPFNEPVRGGGFSLIVRRVGAYLIDIVLLFAVLFPAGWLLQRLLPQLVPANGPHVWFTILWNFSIPVWLYFTASDASARGMTIGKRAMRIRVMARDGQRLPVPQALVRTAVKLLPWELVHVSAFALSRDFAQFSPVQAAGLITSNVLIVVYLAVALATGGRRSVHDLVAGTTVGGATLASRAAE